MLEKLFIPNPDAEQPHPLHPRKGVINYRFRTSGRNISQDHPHVRGYKEQGNINTPLELAIKNQIDRFSFNLVIDVIDRVPSLGSRAAYVKEKMKNEIIDNLNYAHTEGIDKPEIVNWKWPY